MPTHQQDLNRLEISLPIVFPLMFNLNTVLNIFIPYQARPMAVERIRTITSLGMIGATTIILKAMGT